MPNDTAKMHAQLNVACPDPIQYRQLQLRPQPLVRDGEFFARHQPQHLDYKSSRIKSPFGNEFLRLPEFSDRRASYSPDFSSFESLYCEPSIQVGRRETYTSSIE